MVAANNRTIRVDDGERARLLGRVARPCDPFAWDRIVLGDMEDVCPTLPAASVDLLILDPPYNLRKQFAASTFDRRSESAYEEQFRRWLDALLPALRSKASIYVCADWGTSAIVQPILGELFRVRNRITWEREKGRGASLNWKNTSEDIWFCTRGADYTFHPDRVRVRRPVIAPYRGSDGKPKDWTQSAAGSYRDTAPANLWTDLTVPFWSMPENTDHPTQKPEKLIAKLMLASSNPGDTVLDPFLGSGTSAVVARKLGRRWLGIEREPLYCALGQKRVDASSAGDPIQGYRDGVFLPRNAPVSRARRDSLPAPDSWRLLP